jgi:hypothetical protein
MMPRWWSISHVNPRFLHAALVVAALIFSSQLALAEFTQQGPKLVGTGAVGYAEQGFSVSISGDGNTAIVGGPFDNSATGAAWIFTRSGGVWSQQGLKLVGASAIAGSQQAQFVDISADDNTAIVGGLSDNDVHATAWIFARNNAPGRSRGTS